MRIVLAEDQYLLRDGMTHLLGARGFTVVAAVDNPTDLMEALLAERPDLAIVDVRLPPTFTDEGVSAAMAARKRLPGLPILVLSQHVQQVYARDLLADGQGAIGYLLKDRVLNSSQFIDALKVVAAGGTVMDPEVVGKLMIRNSARHGIGSLTERETDVLRLMAEGSSNANIAQRLGISEGAIGKHTASIFGKLDLPPSDETNRRVLAVLAYLNSADLDN
ncbi:response regulator transcription factor [Rugosimonospora acidiphila]|uniref:response regulator transcription factor n=1 Tax=Rugosimonospora acidiphila TaxID=556531 RepID=UPI0031E6A3A5